MLRRFSKKKQNKQDGEGEPSSSSSSSSEDVRKRKKLLSKFLDFITSSIWSIPIASFIESQSVVFDRQQMETEIYYEIHKEYSTLIDTLVCPNFD
uniref:Cilia- and flagella-associated protein 36 n=1 Tax=Caenorhabditis japonica TaxID=281687 RepID=A0A8R1IH44_CAEJA